MISSIISAISGGIQLALFYIKNHRKIGHVDNVKKAVLALQLGDVNDFNAALVKLRADWINTNAASDIADK